MRSTRRVKTIDTPCVNVVTLSGPSAAGSGSGTADIHGSITTGTAAPVQQKDKATGSTVTVSGENGPGEGRDKLTDDTSQTN